MGSLCVIVLVCGAVLWTTIGRRWAERPTRAQCAELQLLFVEHLSRARESSVSAETIAARQRALQDRPERSSEIDRCAVQLTAAQVECALRASNVDELERCVQ